MSNFNFTNNATTTLSGAIGAGATSFTVSLGTGAKFPQLASGGVFSATLTDAATKTVFEIVYVTAISGDTVTVQRGQEGTTARSWLAGDIFSNNVTAAALNNFAQQHSPYLPQVIYQAGTLASFSNLFTLSFSATAPVNGVFFLKSNINLNQQVTSTSGIASLKSALFDVNNPSNIRTDTTKMPQSQAITISATSGQVVSASLTYQLAYAQDLTSQVVFTAFIESTFWPS